MIEDAFTVRIRNIVVKHFNNTEIPITESTHFRDDLGADSLDTVELIMAIEEDLKVDIDDNDKIHDIHTFGEMMTFLRKQEIASA